ncbi:phosphatidylethanolamine-binding protein [Talaromyces pinophilus]|uniref:Phosphatidylethanolamine-binding protein n=1 Tax=Talaromyces pinophilus TaxID=128442 RepID=A0A0B8N502_TALPI|nr:phosphatidylethanolamine-binding protein [Talaromyces pinophilus]
MPDVSKHAAVLQDLKNGTVRTLGVSIGPVTITPGQKIAKAETHQTPKLTAPSDLPKDSSYTVICLDLDAPFISWNFMSPIAHLVQTDLKISQTDEEGDLELKSSEPTLGSWVGAGPPPGAQPHRYVFYLYEQKSDSSIASKIKPFSYAQRIRVNFDALVKQLDLGKLVAANYFVSN